MDEIWKPVVNYEGYYEVSNKGNVRSVDRYIRTGKYYFLIFLKGKNLKVNLRKRDNRRFVNLKKHGSSNKKQISKLVAESFIGKIPNGFYVLHKNDDLSDDSLDNIYIGTPKENSRDCKINGKERYCYGNKHGLNKLSKEQIKNILKMKNENITQREIGEIFNISQSYVSELLNSKKRIYLDYE